MSGLCGWFDPSGGGSANADIESMGATLARFDASLVRSKVTTWGAVAVAATVANGDLYEDGERLVVVYGHGRFSDTRLSDSSHRDGLARAIAEGYVERGAEVLKLL